MIKRIVLKNLFFYWRKAVLAAALVSFLLFLGVASFLFTQRIKSLADGPLRSLKTEIILQQDNSNKDAGQIRTSGVIEPFNLKSFERQKVLKKLEGIKGIKQISSALVLWQFDLKNNRTIVGLDVNDPLVGLRAIEKLLMPKGRFFSANDAQEAILERHFARLFGYKLGGLYKIAGKSYRIVGIVDFKEESNLSNAQVFVPYKTALVLAGRKQAVANQLFVSLNSASLLAEVQKEIGSVLPDFSIITKDRLLKNLSSFHRLVYGFGSYLSLGIAVLVFLLIFWILKINRLELAHQTEILKIIGWPKTKIRLWIFLEIFFIFALSLFVALVLATIFSGLILPHIGGGPLLDQRFKL